MRRVGFALLPKKVHRVVTEELREVSQSSGIELLYIHPNEQLEDYGHLDAIVQKLPNDKEWEQKLDAYSQQVPSCIILDAPDSVQRLRSRETQLDVLQQNVITVQAPEHEPNNRFKTCKIRAPRQVTIQPHGTAADAVRMLQDAGLQLPVALKCMAPEGDPAAHQVVVLRDQGQLEAAVEALQHPAILQEFVAHLPAVFKVYVLGDHTHLDIRRTLPQAAAASTTSALHPNAAATLPPGTPSHPTSSPAHASAPTPDSSKPPGLATAQPLQADEISALLRSLQQYSGIQIAADPGSCPVAASAAVSTSPTLQTRGHLDMLATSSSSTSAAPPTTLEELLPGWVIREAAMQLRTALHLNLFNFDVLLPTQQLPGSCLQMFVVDINYFPGDGDHSVACHFLMRPHQEVYSLRMVQSTLPQLIHAFGGSAAHASKTPVVTPITIQALLAALAAALHLTTSRLSRWSLMTPSRTGR